MPALAQDITVGLDAQNLACGNDNYGQGTAQFRYYQLTIPANTLAEITTTPTGFLPLTELVPVCHANVCLGHTYDTRIQPYTLRYANPGPTANFVVMVGNGNPAYRTTGTFDLTVRLTPL